MGDLVKKLIELREDWELEDYKEAYSDQWDEMPLSIKECKEKMEEFIVKIDSLNLDNSRITKDNFAKYNRVKEYLREARRQLRELATKTKSACEDLELFVDGWEDNKRENKREYFKEQV